jgi:hypothetical protein
MENTTKHITEVIPNERGYNFTVKCSCGTTIGVASTNPAFAQDAARRHVEEAPFREEQEARWRAEDEEEERQRQAILSFDFETLDEEDQWEYDHEPDPDTDREERWAKSKGLW